MRELQNVQRGILILSPQRRWSILRWGQWELSFLHNFVRFAKLLVGGRENKSISREEIKFVTAPSHAWIFNFYETSLAKAYLGHWEPLMIKRTRTCKLIQSRRGLCCCGSMSNRIKLICEVDARCGDETRIAFFCSAFALLYPSQRTCYGSFFSVLGVE